MYRNWREKLLSNFDNIGNQAFCTDSKYIGLRFFVLKNVVQNLCPNKIRPIRINRLVVGFICSKLLTIRLPLLTRHNILGIVNKQVVQSFIYFYCFPHLRLGSFGLDSKPQTCPLFSQFSMPRQYQ